MLFVRPLLALGLLVVIACGPAPRKGPGFGDDDGIDSSNGCVPSPENSPATCFDNFDNDCDGVVDCADPDCSGVGQCPVCGMVQHPTGSPVDLPDGIIGASCTTNAQCSGGTPNCVEAECHASYTSKLNFTGFGTTQKLTQISDIQSVCVNISHEWLRDMEISLVAPSGEILIMDKFLGRSGGEIFLGHPSNTDGDCPTCTTEQGADYCWKPTATNMPMLPYANANGAMTSYGGHSELPPGDYQAADPWTNLVGAKLNGDWTIVVTDLWPEDAGVIHEWSIAFDPTAVQDCSGPVIQ